MSNHGFTPSGLLLSIMTEWSDLAQKVHQHITEEKLLAKGDRILVALSGGRDSVALLYVLHELSAAWKWTLIAAHVNHGLRPGDDVSESLLCRHIAHDLGLELLEEKLSIPHNGNLEQTARVMRYDSLEKWAVEKQCRAIVTGHHLDDQAETVFYRILKGSGLYGLTGIHVSRDKIRRPLLTISREEISTYCHTHGLVYADDHSNRDETFIRNRIRYSVIPYLKKNGFPQVSHHLARLAESAAISRKVLETYLQKDLDSLVTETSSGIVIDRVRWKSFDYETQVLLLKEFFLIHNPAVSHTSRESIRRLVHFLNTAEKGQIHQMTENLTWVVDHETIHITSGIDKGKNLIWVPGTTVQWTPWITLEWDYPGTPAGWDRSSFEEFFTDDLIHIKVYIQEWSSGDRMDPMGNSKHLVSDLLKDAGVPAVIRSHYPVVRTDKDIIWIPGIRRSDKYTVSQNTKNCVRLRCTLQKEYYDIIRKKSHH